MPGDCSSPFTPPNSAAGRADSGETQGLIYEADRITDPIERAATTIPGVDHIESKTTAGLSLVTIAVGWVFYRPMIGIPLLLVGVGSIGAVFFMRKKA